METPEELSSLGAAIKAARTRAGLTQREAADKTRFPNRDYRSWQDWEKNKGNAWKNIRTIEDALGLPMGYFNEQLSLMERFLALEEQLLRIEASIQEVLGQQRGVRELLKLLVDT